MSRFTAILLLALAVFVSPAFSDDAPTSTTTHARIVGPMPPPQGPQVFPQNPPPGEGINPETGLSRSTVVRPLREFPPPPNATPAPVPAPAPGTPSPSASGHIALILPTASPTLGRLAEALREGFAAAVQVAGKDGPPVDLIAVDNEGPALLAACKQAQAAGAILVIGAITRDGANTLATSECSRQPVLELNDPQSIPVEQLPPNLYTVSLSIEQEAKQVALMAVADGRRSAIVIASSTPLAKRVEDAFEREWTRAAGQVQRIPFDGDPDDAMKLRATLENNTTADMAFIALETNQARTIRPYIPATLPLYATSLSVNPRAETLVNLDLQGLRYVEMPWFVQPDNAAVMAYPQPSAPMGVDQERLYAFGIDAYRLALHLLRGEARKSALDGVTGKITLGPGNAFERILTPAEVDGGHVIPLRAP